MKDITDAGSKRARARPRAKKENYRDFKIKKLGVPQFI